MPAPIHQKPPLEPYPIPPPTQASLDWAPLAIIDLSKFEEPNGKHDLAAELKDAVKHWGFWTIVGSGFTQEELDRQLAIGNTFFKLPLEEKRKFACDFSVGNYFGYREPTRFISRTDVKENMEMLNVPKFTSDYASIPQHQLIKSYHDEIAKFHRRVWDDVIRKLFVLFAIILELPENYFVDRHSYEAPSEDHLRYVVEDDKKISDQWTAGHTDFGSLTLLFSQPVAALQVKDPNNEWKWVKYVPGGITCNAADTLSFLTKGYIKSTIHRVVRPPPDQTHLERLGLFYFARPGNDVPMVPAPSPVLFREELMTENETKVTEDSVSGYEYVRARVKNVHDRKATRIAENNPDAMFQVKNLTVQDYYV
ncbi:gibberellin 2-oxidase [Desarmillaria tabescens]|uniref:Gibberellin 2-oxidase n=1 Tax=Armillaria tabescens TaxID=1929756 RepID=A0AA39NBM8_ARMTA|nr:gibberellin 2-oxidase [Desarmillaria tabescens]KAK0462574.1 gibberellin 2-oxidase [Desarmillaria tabescens]